MEDATNVLTSVHHKSVVPGTTILGVVRSVTATFARVALPDGQRGVVYFEDVSAKHADAAASENPDSAPALPYVFPVGSFIVAAVIGQDRAAPGCIRLTTRPAVVNAALDWSLLGNRQPIWAEVASDEETGFALRALGPDGRPDNSVAALPKIVGRSAAPTLWLPAKYAPDNLVAGMVLLTSVHSMDAAQITVRPIRNGRGVSETAANREHLNFEALRPGMLVDSATVTGELSRAGALEVTALGFAGGVMSRLAAAAVTRPKNGNWVNHQTGKVRITAVDHVNRRFWLSAVPAVVGLKKWTPVALGDILSGTIMSVGEHRGLEFNYTHPETEQVIPVVVPMKFISDAEKPTLTPAQAPGKEVRARVLSLNPMDGVIVASAQHSALNAAVLNIGDISIGDVLDGVVEKVDANVGVVVRISPVVRGLIPLAQLADDAPFGGLKGETTPIFKQLLRGFRPNTRVKVRVLNFDKTTTRVILTAKKALVTAGHLPTAATAAEDETGKAAPIDWSAAWENLEDVRPGDRSVGIVVTAPVRGDAATGSRARGARILFFNGLLGHLPARRLPSLRLGQPVHVSASEVDAASGRLVVCLCDPETGRRTGGYTRLSKAARLAKAKEAALALYSDAGRILIEELWTEAAGRRAAARAAARTAKKEATDDEARSAALKQTAADAKAAAAAAAAVGSRVLFAPRSISPCGMWYVGELTGCGNTPARVHITEVSDAWTANPFTAITEFRTAARAAGANRWNRVMPAVVTHVPAEGTSDKFDIIQVSLRTSRMNVDCQPKQLVEMRAAAGAGTVAPARPKAPRDVRAGKRYFGYIRAVGPAGIFVALSSAVVARVSLSDATDSFARPAQLARALPVGAVVAVRAIGKADPAGRVTCVARPSVVARHAAPYAIRDLRNGSMYAGRVRRVDERHGVFIDMDGAYPPLTALARRNDALDINAAADEADEELLADMYAAGDDVIMRVLRTNPARGQVAAGLKPTLFSAADIAEARRAAAGAAALDVVPHLLTPERVRAAASAAAEDSAEAESEAEYEYDGSSEYDDSSEYDSESEESEADEAEVTAGVEAALAAPGITELDWAMDTEAPTAGAARAEPDLASETASEEEEAEEAGEEAAAAAVTAARDAAIEAAAGTQVDETHFERLLAGAGSTNVATWLEYATHYAAQAKLHAARAVLERALAAIPADSTADRVRVWVAAAVLEQKFGTPASFKKALRTAVATVPAHTLYPALAEELIREGAALAAAEALADAIRARGLRRERATHHIWAAAVGAMFAAGQAEAARAAAASAANSLASAKKDEGVAVRVALARGEFAHAEPARGRTIFEELLADAPKRSDLWRQYADLETAVATTGGDADAVAEEADLGRVRNIFTRAVASVPPRAREGLYKHWYTFEERFGGETEAVRQAALAEQERH